MAKKKTAKISFDNLKDPDGWNELIHELKWNKFEAEHPDLDEDELCEKFYKEIVSKTFQYGEFGAIEIEVDEDLNIVGGKVFSCGK